MKTCPRASAANTVVLWLTVRGPAYWSYTRVSHRRDAQRTLRREDTFPPRRVHGRNGAQWARRPLLRRPKLWACFHLQSTKWCSNRACMAPSFMEQVRGWGQPSDSSNISARAKHAQSSGRRHRVCRPTVPEGSGDGRGGDKGDVAKFVYYHTAATCGRRPARPASPRVLESVLYLGL